MADHPAPRLNGRETPVYTPQARRPLTWPPRTEQEWADWCGSVVPSEREQTITAQ
jgi:hypothetical protein